MSECAACDSSLKDGLPPGYAGWATDPNPAWYGAAKERGPASEDRSRQKCIFNANWITRGRFS